MSWLKGKVLGYDTMEDSEGLLEVKEEVEDEVGCVGGAMADFLSLREGMVDRNSGYGRLIPGVEALPGGRVPELLGLSETEIAQALPSRAAGPFVPYLGESGVAVGRARGESSSRGSRRSGSKLQATRREGSRRLPMSLSERRRRRKKTPFGSGGPIRLLGGINREPQNRPLQAMWRDTVRPVAAIGRQRENISLFGAGHCYKPVSWHRQRYDESSEGFGKTGRYHPEDARLKANGVLDAIYEDLQLYKIPPAYWPEPLTFSDFYHSSSSSDDSGSSGKFGLFVHGEVGGVWRFRVRLGGGRCGTCCRGR